MLTHMPLTCHRSLPCRLPLEISDNLLKFKNQMETLCPNIKAGSWPSTTTAASCVISEHWDALWQLYATFSKKYCMEWALSSFLLGWFIFAARSLTELHETGALLDSWSTIGLYLSGSWEMNFWGITLRLFFGPQTSMASGLIALNICPATGRHHTTRVRNLVFLRPLAGHFKRSTLIDGWIILDSDQKWAI